MKPVLVIQQLFGLRRGRYIQEGCAASTTFAGLPSKRRRWRHTSCHAGENLRLALIHLIQIIGEAGRQVSREFSDRHLEIPWTDIIGMRHKVVHACRGRG